MDIVNKSNKTPDSNMCKLNDLCLTLNRIQFIWNQYWVSGLEKVSVIKCWYPHVISFMKSNLASSRASRGGMSCWWRTVGESRDWYWCRLSNLLSSFLSLFSLLRYQRITKYQIKTLSCYKELKMISWTLIEPSKTSKCLHVSTLLCNSCGWSICFFGTKMIKQKIFSINFCLFWSSVLNLDASLT